MITPTTRPTVADGSEPVPDLAMLALQVGTAIVAAAAAVLLAFVR